MEKDPVDELRHMISKMPKYMHPDFSLINNLSDLECQCTHEINLAEEGGIRPTWSKVQLHRAKMYASEVHIRAGQQGVR